VTFYKLLAGRVGVVRRTRCEIEGLRWHPLCSFPRQEDHTMLNAAITFFVIALIAALLGFGGVAGMSANIGWLLAVLGVVVLAIGLLGRALGGGRGAIP
jgi:uncharacterized membrane protein YtjA (UPF0391 family)